MAGVARGDLLEVRIRRGAVAQGAHRCEALFRPVGGRLQAVKQPAPERAPFLVVPRFHVPAALVLRPFEQADEPVRLDQLDTALDQGAVVGRPVAGNLGDGGGAVPREPRRLQFTRRHAPRHDDLERSLAESERWWFALFSLLVCITIVFVDDVVEPVALPVKFLLKGNHACQ